VLFTFRKTTDEEMASCKGKLVKDPRQQRAMTVGQLTLKKIIYVL
jgi:hypothetical protein